MKLRAAIIILMLMTISCTRVLSRPDSQSIQDGAGSFTFTDAQGNPDKPITVWYYKPSAFSSRATLVFVMHGAKRDAQRYRDEWAAYAEHAGFLLIVPEFSHKYYPGIREYNQGNLFDKMEKPIPENDRAFTVIEHLFDFVKDATQNQSSSYDIYGHSAGGQFVQRMVLFKKNARIRMAIAANPGIYAVASYTNKYPYGIRNSGVTPEDLRAAFERKFILILGEKDVMMDDLNLARFPDALAQGSSSFERGTNFFAAASDEASRLGMTFNWKLTIVSGAAHDDAKLAYAAAQFFFHKGNDE